MLWAVFLGMSWTWVIGMFLPVLLVRDFGLWGWVMFAVPNVLGAAAMAWVLPDAGASERFVRRHAGACFAFSLITIAYHVFFAMWMIQRLKGWGPFVLLACVAWAILTRGNVSRWGGAIAALIVSGVLFYMLNQQGLLALPPVQPGGGGEAGVGAALLLPAFVLGFGLCPYLDLTFHRARQATSPGGGRVAFAAGFGVIFAAMIVFTLLYARWLAPAAAGQSLGPLGTLLLCVHLGVQSAFTVAAHARELPGRAAFVNAGAARFVAIGALIVLAGAAALGWAAASPRDFRGHDFGEAVYWCFLGFYGLVFPSYLWLNARRHAPAGPDPRTSTVLMICVAVAFPMYWMGFAERQPGWLVPGVLVVLAGRLFVTGRGRDPKVSRF